MQLFDSGPVRTYTRTWLDKRGAPRAIERRPCYWCGRPFEYHPKLRIRFCGHRCRCAVRWEGRSTAIPWRRCPTCDTPFVSKRGRSFCTPACYRKPTYYVPAEQTTRSCGYCGGSFSARGTKVYCSSQCARAAENARRRPSKRAYKRQRRALMLGVDSDRYTTADIAVRDQHRCGLCGGKVVMRYTVPHPKSPTVDHIVPLSAGGDNTLANVQLAHFLCNSRKSSGGTQQLRLIG